MSGRAARAELSVLGRHGLLLLAVLPACSEERISRTEEQAQGDAAAAGETAEVELDASAASEPSPRADAQRFEPTASVLRALDSSALELPEGISADSHGDLYVTLAGTGAVLRIGPDGSKVEVARLTLPPPVGGSYIAGITHDATDAMYLAAVSADSAALSSGIYRVPPGGGQPVLFASDPMLSFPNGLTWDDNGHLFVSDNRAGAIFMADRSGMLTLWLQHTLLHGDRTRCEKKGAADSGANGVAFGSGAIYVANSDRGSIVRIPVQPDGSAGSPEAWLAPDCARASLDGIALVDGVMYAADYSHHAILAVDAEGRAAVYASGEVFDNPASLVLWQGRGVRELAITNFALDHARAGEPGNPAVLTLSLPPSGK